MVHRAPLSEIDLGNHGHRDTEENRFAHFDLASIFGVKEHHQPKVTEKVADKGYIDCGWGRLLDHNREAPNYYSHDNVMRGMALLNRQPID